jgi:hypothetical protein
MSYDFRKIEAHEIDKFKAFSSSGGIKDAQNGVQCHPVTGSSRSSAAGSHVA